MTAGVASTVVSVVIPVRDMERTIGAQLEALTRQDFDEAWEVIVADNGSSDGTVGQVDRWRERLPLRLVDASGLASAGYARNVGAAAAAGELLIFCDADDQVRPSWLRAMVQTLQHSPIVAGRYAYFKLNPASVANAYDQDENGVPWWEFLCGAASGNLGIRRSVFEQVGGFRTDYRRGEDTEFCWRAQLAGHRLTVEPAAVVDRFVKTTSAWSLFAVHVEEGKEVVRLYQAYRQHGMPRSRLRGILYDCAMILAFLVTGRRHKAARIAGWRGGRLLGSIQSGVLFW